MEAPAAAEFIAQFSGLLLVLYHDAIILPPKIALRQHMPLIQGRSKLLADQVSEQQTKVANYSVGGLSFKAIARLMDLSPATIRYYLTIIYRKLGVKNKIQLAEMLRDAE
ncbi:MAG: helix-turn-helix domain-containing protein [Pseudomonadota bacterium]